MRITFRLCAIVVLLVPFIGSSSAVAGSRPHPTPTPSIAERTRAYELRHPEAKRVEGGVTEPVPIRQVNPKLPEGVKGTLSRFTPIVVVAVVNTVGEVLDPQVISSQFPELEPPILAAVRQWRYKPALQNGRPVSVVLHVVVRLEPR